MSHTESLLQVTSPMWEQAAIEQAHAVEDG